MKLAFYFLTSDVNVRNFFNTWWQCIFLGSRRDQMSFTYFSWKENINISAIQPKLTTVENNRFFFEK